MDHAFEIKSDGKIHLGHWRVEKGVLHVSSAFGSKATRLGNSPPEVLARLMLSELARENNA